MQAMESDSESDMEPHGVNDDEWLAIGSPYPKPFVD